MFKYCVFFTLLVLCLSQSCVSPKQPFIIRRTYKGSSVQESIQIWKGSAITGLKLYEYSGKNQENTVINYDVCLEPSVHTFVALDNHNDGWDNGSFFQILTSDNIVILQGTLDRYSRLEWTFYPVYSISTSSTWKFTGSTQSTNSWTTSSFDDNSWSVAKAGEFGSKDTITRYYRNKITLPTNRNDFAIFELGVYTQYGVVAYANGNEIYRFNMPAASTASTPCVSSSLNSAFRRITQPISGITGTELTIAIEVHSNSATAVVDSFKGFLLMLYGPCVTRTQDGTVASNHPADWGGEEMGKVFDDDIQTKWYSNGLNTYVDYTFNSGRREWFNKYSITTGNWDSNRKAKEWKVMGKNEGGDWVLLDYKNNVNIQNQRETTYYTLPNNKIAYNSVRFLIISTAAGTETETAEIEYYSCNYAIEPVTLAYPQIVYNFIKNMDRVDIYPTQNGFQTFTISPPLPAGLSFDTKSGNIYGIPTAVANTMQYTISATHSIDGSKSFLLTIAVSECTAPNMRVDIYQRAASNGYGGVEKYDLYNSANNLIYSQSLESTDGSSWRDHKSYLCIPSGLYKIVATAPSTAGFAYGSYISVDFYGKTSYSYAASRFSLLYKLTDSFNFYAQYEAPTAFLANLAPATINANWVQNTFDETGWITYTPSTTQATGSVWLFRYKFSTDNNNVGYQKAQGYEIRFSYRAGIIVYVDGTEMYRLYVDGTLTPTSTATGGVTSITDQDWKFVTGTMNGLTVGSHVIAIAYVHKSPYSPINADFDLNFRWIVDSDKNARTWDLSALQSSYFSSDSKADKLFDQNFKTRMDLLLNTDHPAPQWGLGVYSGLKRESINKYCVINGYDSTYYDPKKWTLEGSISGTTWEVLDTQQNMIWTSRTQRACFYMPNQNQSYNRYRFSCQEISGPIDANSRCIVGEIEFYIVDYSKIIVSPLAYSSISITGYEKVELPTLYPTSDFYRNFAITTGSLPSGVTLSTGLGVIAGIPTVSGSFPVTISATSPTGQTQTVSLTISISQCQNLNTLFSLQFLGMTSDSYQNGFTLKNPSGVLMENVDNFPNYLNTFTKTYCGTQGVYTLILKDQVMDGWGSGTVKVLNEDDSVLLTETVRYGESPKTVRFNIGSFVREGHQEWMYTSNRYPGSSWTSITFDDKTWSKAKPGNFNSLTGTTAYYRASFTVSDVEAFSIYEFTASIKAGIVAYLNGIEIYRYHVNNGIINEKSMAIQEFDSVTKIYTSNSVQFSSLVTGTNVLAVEIHRYTDVLESTFDAGLKLYLGELNRVIGGVVSTNVKGFNDNTYHEGEANAFDGIATTKYYGDQCGKPIYLDYTYSNNRKEFVSKFAFARGNMNNRIPTSIKLYATDDGNKWDLLVWAFNFTIGSYNTQSGTISYSFYNDRAYAAYRVYLESNTCTEGLEAAEIYLYADRISNYCNAEGAYKAAVDNSRSYKSCPKYYDGSLYKECHNKVWSAEVNACTIAMPQQLNYTAVSFVFNTKRSNKTPNPVIPAIDYILTIHPELPAGLTFNARTGVISGEPQEDFAEKTYTITCTNVVGSSETLITLSSVPPPTLGAGTIVLIVVAALIVLIFVGIIIFVVVNRSKGRGRKNSHRQMSTAGSKKLPQSTSSTEKKVRI